MTNIYVVLAIIITNGIAIGMLYQMIKKLPKKEALVFTAVSVATIYILVSLVYILSGIGIDINIHELTKSFITYLFVPINVIFFVPYFTIQYKKFRKNEISKDKLIKKTIILAIVLIIALVIEFFCFRFIQKNIVIVNSIDKQNEILQNENITIQNETVTNENNNINNNI